MNETFDVIIAGGGPAGLAAGLYAARMNLKSVLVDRGPIGGQLLNTELIEDYPGFPSILGRELAEKMGEHARHFGLDIREYEPIDSIDVTPEGTKLPRGEVAGHIRNLILKAGLQDHEHRLDQTLLLRGLADTLRGPNQLGSYASDALMKLGLLGTIVGFIMMLAPIAGLDAADRVSVKSSMGLMSDGMAVAMYTTLTGLIGSILVQTQYYMLDKATQRLFGLATNLTEVFVVSVLERGQHGQLR